MTEQARFSPACHKALQFLEKQIRIARRNGTDRLPPIAELAKSAGVSTASMHKASSYLCDRGVLLSVPRRGTVIADASRTPRHQVHEPATPFETPARWQIVKRDIHERILRGDYVSGAMLPPYKELYQAYGTGFATLKKALNVLVSQGLLVPCRRGYRVFSSSTSRPASAILFVSKLPVASAVRVGPESSLPFSLAVQREVHRAGCGMEVVDDLYGKGESQWMHEIHAVMRRRTVLGIAFSALHFISDESRRIIRSLSRLNVPVALLETTRTVYPNTEFITARNVRLFAISSQYQAGQRVANHLLAHGHRRVCYISPFGSALWSQQRLLGAQSIYESSEGQAAVHPFVSESWVDKGRAREAITASSRFDRVVTASESIERYFGDPPGQSGAFLEQHALPYLLNENVRTTAEPLFTRALEEANSTAWILGNDAVMSMAYDFLTRRGVAVPQAISLIGFDDSTGAALRSLDSYNFNVSRVVQTALGYILASVKSGRERHPDTLVEIPGFIVSRGSVRTVANDK